MPLPRLRGRESFQFLLESIVAQKKLLELSVL